MSLDIRILNVITNPVKYDEIKLAELTIRGEKYPAIFYKTQYDRKIRIFTQNGQYKFYYSNEGNTYRLTRIKIKRLQ